MHHEKHQGPNEVEIDLSHVRVNPQNGVRYTVTFEEAGFLQRNNASGATRGVISRRHRIEPELSRMLPVMPADIQLEEDALLPTFTGQLIQVVKQHENREWVFGSVLYDDANHAGGSAEPVADAAVRKGFHDACTSGWFPRCLTKPGNYSVVQKLLRTVGEGGMDVLRPPSTWAAMGSDGDTRQISVSEGTKEYRQVTTFFLERLGDLQDHFEIIRVDRIQNLSLWKCYAVKQQTMASRNHGGEDVERRWLFHGTREQVTESIIHSGYKCTFAGLRRGYHRYGMGVYFASTSEVSSQDRFSERSSNDIKYVFLNRVAVGDFTLGRPEYRVPPRKPDNSAESYDSTVNDETHPTTFVVYHDSQAYPEYLVAFRHKHSQV